MKGTALFVVSRGGHTIGTYDLATGAALNASFISGLNFPMGVHVSGEDLYVTNWNGNNGAFPGYIGKYDASTGAEIDAKFIDGLDLPYGITVRNVPEPVTAALALLGGLALLPRRRLHNSTRS